MSLFCDGPGGGGGNDSSGGVTITHVGTARPSGRYNVGGTTCDPSVWRWYSSQLRTNTNTAGHDHGQITVLFKVLAAVMCLTPFGRGQSGAWLAYQSSS